MIISRISMLKGEKKKLLTGIVFVIILSNLISCNDENHLDHPIVYTGKPTNIDTTGVTFHGKVFFFGTDLIVDYGFMWKKTEGTSFNNSDKILFAGSPVENVISYRVTDGIRKNQRLYVRFFVKTEKYTAFGKPFEFIVTDSNPP